MENLEIANDWTLFSEYAGPESTYTEEDFNSLPLEERMFLVESINENEE